MCESLVVRLNLFNGDYPAFMPHVVKAILEHPNLSQVDYDLLDTYAKMFELDWRGDRSIQNKKEFLSSNPVYLRDKSNVNAYENMDTS